MKQVLCKIKCKYVPLMKEVPVGQYTGNLYNGGMQSMMSSVRALSGALVCALLMPA